MEPWARFGDQAGAETLVWLAFGIIIFVGVFFGIFIIALLIGPDRTQ